MKITKEILRDCGACPPGYKKFLQRYPDGFEVTEKGIRKALATGMDPHYLAGELFTEEATQAAHAATKAHAELAAAQRAEYDALRAQAWRNAEKLAPLEKALRRMYDDAEIAGLVAGCREMGWLKEGDEN